MMTILTQFCVTVCGVLIMIETGNINLGLAAIIALLVLAPPDCRK
jgi:hypothetical protein